MSWKNQSGEAVVLVQPENNFNSLGISLKYFEFIPNLFKHLIKSASNEIIISFSSPSYIFVIVELTFYFQVKSLRQYILGQIPTDFPYLEHEFLFDAFSHYKF
jgi:HKD family nuclease